MKKINKQNHNIFPTSLGTIQLGTKRGGGHDFSNEKLIHAVCYAAVYYS